MNVAQTSEQTRGSVIRVARASRVLAKASRLRGLLARIASDFVYRICSGAAGKFVSAGRRNQHARRARYPEFPDRAFYRI